MSNILRVQVVPGLPMRVPPSVLGPVRFAYICAIYLISTLLIAALTSAQHDYFTALLAAPPRQKAMQVVMLMLWGIMLLNVHRRPARTGWMDPILGAAIASITLFSVMGAAFTSGKSLMSQLSPFWADPYFADLDRWLHFGRDAWVVYYPLFALIPLPISTAFYYSIWAVLSAGFVLALPLIEREHTRAWRFYALYAITWVVLGNMVAWIFLSVGPVYYAALLGDAVYQPLFAAQAQVGLTPDTTVGMLQTQLWSNFVNGEGGVGLAISAFPSLHVAMATIVLFYAIEKGRFWAALAGINWAIIQIGSVGFGWHYAVDGYFSTLFVAAVWFILRQIDKKGIM